MINYTDTTLAYSSVVYLCTLFMLIRVCPNTKYKALGSSDQSVQKIFCSLEGNQQLWF